MREVKQTIVDVRNPTHRVEKKLEEIDETEYGNVTSSEKESQRQLGSHTTLEDDEPLAGEEVEIERTEGEEVKVPETLSRTTSMDGGKGPDESIYLNDGTLKGVLGDVFDVWGSKDEKIDDEEETIENLQKKLDVLKAPIKLKKGYKEGLMLETADLKRASMEVFNWRPGDDIEQLKQLSTSAKMNGLNQMKNPNYYDIWEAAQLGNYDSNEKSYWDKITSITLEALTELEQGNYSL
jgi:hypothetical protein